MQRGFNVLYQKTPKSLLAKSEKPTVLQDGIAKLFFMMKLHLIILFNLTTLTTYNNSKYWGTESDDFFIKLISWSPAKKDINFSLLLGFSVFFIFESIDFIDTLVDISPIVFI